MARRYKSIKKLPQYFIRTAWDAKDTQFGEYTILEEAKEALMSLDENWSIYGTEDELIFTNIPEEEEEIVELEQEEVCPWALGDIVKLTESAQEASASPYRFCRFYVRKINENSVTIATTKTAGLFGEVAFDEIEKFVDKVEAIEDAPLHPGDLIHLRPDAKRIDGTPVRKKLFTLKLYAHNIRDNGDIVVSLEPNGSIYSVITKDSVGAIEPAPKFNVKVINKVISIMEKPATNSKIVAQETQDTILPIYEKNGQWLKTKEGWVYGSSVKRT